VFDVHNGDSTKTDVVASGYALARNTFWNLISYGSPTVVAVFTIPLLIAKLGMDRFGVLTLSWIVIGYFNLFDFGLGRALTKLVAEKIGLADERVVPSLVWTGLFLMLVLGVFGTIVASLLSPWLVHTVLKIPNALRLESLQTFYLIAFSIPIVIFTTGLRGFLEAYQKFGLITMVSLPLGVFTFLGPLLALSFTHDLFIIIAILILGRVCAGLAYLCLCFKTLPTLRHIALDRTVVGRLLSFGGWITVTNIVGPLMVYLDRFLIGALLSITAVVYYTTPYDIVTKLLLIPSSLTGVLFPAFSTAFGIDKARSTRLFIRGVKYIYLIMFPTALFIIIFANEGLGLWLGHDFASQSVRVLQWLAVGVFVNALAQVPYSLVQAAGRADIAAKLHLVELPLYLMALWWLIERFGIEGVAMAWVARVTIDTVVLFILANRVSNLGIIINGNLVFLLVFAMMTFSAGSLLNGLILKASFLGIIIVSFMLLTWQRILSPSERTLLRNPRKLFSTDK
jgi:O-antigen/teichoic acid export membrane protein